MLYEKLKLEILAAREEREQQRLSLNKQSSQTLLQIGLNLPGVDKSPLKGKALLRWALPKLQPVLPQAQLLAQGTDLLGPWAFLSTAAAAESAKQHAVNVEEAQPAARLLDIDVFSAQGKVVGRKELGLAERSCLLCLRPAVECIRLKCHSLAALKVRADELLATFRS